MTPPKVIEHRAGDVLVIPGTTRLLAKVRVAMNMRRAGHGELWAVVTLTADALAVDFHVEGFVRTQAAAVDAIKHLELGDRPKLQSAAEIGLAADVVADLKRGGGCHVEEPPTDEGPSGECESCGAACDGTDCGACPAGAANESEAGR